MVFAALLAFALSGCGNAKPTQKAAAAAKIVYTTLDDCADAGKLTFEKCTEAIDRALTQHERAATKHRLLKQCEDAEGVDRCERTPDGTFRVRPAGYLFTISQSIAAMPLYAGLKGAAHYRAADGATFDPEKPDNVEYSDAAAKRAADFAPVRGGSRRG